MGKSELREELIRFCDSIRNYEHESGHSIYQDERESSELVDIFLALPNYSLDESEDDSHSPTEPGPYFPIEKEGVYMIKSGDDHVLGSQLHPTNPGNPFQFDTLCEGDLFQGTEEQQRRILDLSLKNISMTRSEYDMLLRNEFLVYSNGHIRIHKEYCKTKLTPEEFLRRAENTFKK